MNMDSLCRIPVSAAYTVYKGSDMPVMTKVEYADIPADTIARFLLEKFGADAIFEGREARR